MTARDGEEDGDDCNVENEERTDWYGWCKDGDGCGEEREGRTVTCRNGDVYGETKKKKGM